MKFGLYFVPENSIIYESVLYYILPVFDLKSKKKLSLAVALVLSISVRQSMARVPVS
jgi:hypothetical protein